jgi:hypothetical protein
MHSQSNKLKLFIDRSCLQTPIMPYLTHSLLANKYHERKADSRSDSKAAMLRSTLVDNYGQQQLSSSAINMYAPLIKGPKRASKGVRLSPITTSSIVPQQPLSCRAMTNSIHIVLLGEIPQPLHVQLTRKFTVWYITS